ncbi:MAG: hypothetical protein AB7S41_06705 [Parvibaculaceae bacterium]
MKREEGRLDASSRPIVAPVLGRMKDGLAGGGAIAEVEKGNAALAYAANLTLCRDDGNFPAEGAGKPAGRSASSHKCATPTPRLWQDLAAAGRGCSGRGSAREDAGGQQSQA